MKIKVNFEPILKQSQALEILEDKTTEEILFGGGAGGGKSMLGCFWLVMNCLRYPGSRWLLGRGELKRLKESTVKTLFDILGKGQKGLFKFVKDKDFIYNSIEGVVRFPKFQNSEIVFKDMKLQPSDPDFDSLGSTEYTGAFLDEVSEIPLKAKQILLTRLRYKIDDFGIIGKALYCSNPCKHWAYYEFYKPSTNGEIKKSRVFIQSLAKDNEHLPKTYVESLKRADKVTKERLLYGNWEYDDDPAKLMDYDSIVDVFTNDFVAEGEKYITADLAMQGRDNFIIGAWNGMRCKIVGVDNNTGKIVKNLIKPKSSGREIEEDLKKVANELKVSRSHIAPDSGGMGSYLESYMEGIKPFDGARAAYDKEYRNLRSECYFKLAELVNKKEIYIDCDDPVIKELIIEELEQIKRDNVDKDDQKKKIVPKELIKEMLGRSPDFADILMMRMFFVVGMGKSGILKGGGDIFG